MIFPGVLTISLLFFVPGLGPEFIHSLYHDRLYPGSQFLRVTGHKLPGEDRVKNPYPDSPVVPEDKSVFGQYISCAVNEYR